MSNYTQTTFFTPKDSLPITDPNKTFFGAQMDVELASISAAITSKYEASTSNPSLTSLNISSNFIPVNGFNLNAPFTLGFAINSAVVATLNATALTMPAVNLTGSTLPANGFYLQAPNSLGLALNSTLQWNLSGNGLTYQAATGGNQGGGTINAAGLFLNGVGVGGTTNTVVGTGSSTLNASGILVGQTYMVYRNSSLARANNNVITADPVLQLTNVPIGTYTIYMILLFNSTGSSTQGYQVGVTNTGAGSITNSYMHGYAAARGSGSGISFSFNSNTTNFGTTYWGQSLSVSTTWDGCAYGAGGFQVATNPINLQVMWAQELSNATATNILAGSTLVITRLA